jgi:hypothetical protein
MVSSVRSVVFRFYEQTLVRNWFYTLAFSVFVPTGCRFAYIAWRFGAWFDRPLAVIAGTIIGVTSVVTLLRVWEVPPQQTTAPAEQQEERLLPARAIVRDVLSESRRQSATNWQIARDAATLGSTRR